MEGGERSSSKIDECHVRWHVDIAVVWMRVKADFERFDVNECRHRNR